MDVSENLNMTVSSEIDNIIRSLVANSDIIFKSQQRGDSELNASEKTVIALNTFNENKTSFLMKFGKYLGQDQLNFFDQFTKDFKEIELVLQDLKTNNTKKRNIQVKNRRYEALQQMSKENSYFSEIEMMKRNPLLYEHLVGQYLSEDEKRERDKYEMKEDVTLVKILMEGIERNKAELTRQLQQQTEDSQMEESDSSSDSSDEERDVEEISVSVKSARPSTSRWGEFEEHTIQATKSKKSTPMVTMTERLLLKEEFVSTMHQNFVEGKDSDYFDYSTVDDNSSYDNISEMDHDAEDKYFDSEDPDEDEIRDYESSEDELDIYMNALNQHPAVCQLAKSIDERL
ncbi:unnamed protein product [Ceutorhynchus assimilis]|uniref:CCD97-like C-terminal domain-containing protein n=1 Tax=Ceutorhynchus assimilis TaxID=467358 RepID=A0A9N9MI09_9CUCU|nr:unnamed protein product [Ceutorhynchus assimilis]